jgi:hypothetical protein
VIVEEGGAGEQAEEPSKKAGGEAGVGGLGVDVAVVVAGVVDP